ncbi:MAG: MarC family NAAT transporter [Gammaproteobacteria bacterium]|nr:MarC family NAAT transporter [Gammaproteobacteria bacterium]
MIYDLLVLIGVTIGALLPIANPFSTAPVFVTLTRQMTPDRRAQQARMACIYMTSVLVGALLIGAAVMLFFGISIPALRIAGGLVVARVGFAMLNPEPEEELSDESKREALDKRDIAFTPIAMPLLSGPGSIAVTISIATEVDRPLEYVSVAVGIVVVALISWVILRGSTQVVKVLGVTGMNVITRLMGFILVCIGVQFIATGLVEAITHELVVAAVLQSYQ